MNEPEWVEWAHEVLKETRRGPDANPDAQDFAQLALDLLDERDELLKEKRILRDSLQSYFDFSEKVMNGVDGKALRRILAPPPEEAG